MSLIVMNFIIGCPILRTINAAETYLQFEFYNRENVPIAEI